MALEIEQYIPASLKMNLFVTGETDRTLSSLTLLMLRFLGKVKNHRQKLGGENSKLLPQRKKFSSLTCVDLVAWISMTQIALDLVMT